MSRQHPKPSTLRRQAREAQREAEFRRNAELSRQQREQAAQQSQKSKTN